MQKKLELHLFAEGAESPSASSVMPRVEYFNYLFNYLSSFIADLAKVIVWALDAYNEEDPLNVAGAEISIRELSEKIAELLELRSDIVYDLSYSDGPLKRTVSVDKLSSFWPEFEPTDFTAALRTIISNLKI